MKSKLPAAPGANVHLLDLSDRLGSVTRAGRMLGFGWNNSPRLKSEGEQAETVMQHHLVHRVEAAIVAISLEQPSWGPVRLSNELLRRGVDVTTTQIMHVWTLHDLRHRDKRTMALVKTQATLKALNPAPPERRQFHVLVLVERVVLMSLAVGMTLAAITLWSTFF